MSARCQGGCGHVTSEPESQHCAVRRPASPPPPRTLVRLSGSVCPTSPLRPSPAPPSSSPSPYMVVRPASPFPCDGDSWLARRAQDGGRCTRSLCRCKNITHTSCFADLPASYRRWLGTRCPCSPLSRRPACLPALPHDGGRALLVQRFRCRRATARTDGQPRQHLPSLPLHSSQGVRACVCFSSQPPLSSTVLSRKLACGTGLAWARGGCSQPAAPLTHAAAQSLGRARRCPRDCALGPANLGVCTLV